MRQPSIVLLASIVLLSASCNAPKEQEKTPGLKNMAPPSITESVQDGLDVEPNNTPLQAIEVTLTGDAMQWAGELTPDDVDVWKIKAKAGTVAEIILIPESGYDLFADYSPSGNDNDRKYYDTMSSSHDELIPNIRLTPQGGYLTVRARLNEGQDSVRYRLMIRRLEGQDDVQFEGEINDRKETANSLTLPATVEGTLYPSGDVDFFRLPLRNAANIDFELPDGAIEVAVESKDKVIWSSISKQAQTLHSDLLTPELQEVTIRLSALEPIKEALKYQIKLTSPETLPDEIEPNNTIEKAQLIQGDPQKLNLSLLDDVDVDIYKFQLAPDKIFRFRLSGIQAGQASIEPLDQSGLARKDIAYEGQVICDAEPLSGNVFWVKVIPGKAPAWPLNYHIILDEEGKQNVEKEPNQTREQANSFVLDKTVYGHIFPAGDVDIYRIELPSYPAMTDPIGKLTIDVAAGYVAPLSLKLTDAGGFEISKLSNEHLGKPMHLAFDAPNGVYYLEVSGAGDGCLKPYGLKIAFDANEAAEASLKAPKPEAADLVPSPTDAAPAAPAVAAPAPVAPAVAAPGQAAPAGEQPDIPLDALIKAAEGGNEGDKPAASPKNEDDDAF